MSSKAEGRRQNAEETGRKAGPISACSLPAAAGLLLSAFLMWVAAAGCNERSSPAAIPVASASNSREDRSAEASGPAPKSEQRPTRDITFDTIKFDMQKEEPFKRSMITPAIERLDQSKIRIRGYILPSFQQSGLTQFVLVRDNMQCCFGPGAALFDCIVVEMDSGQTTDFTTQPVAVEGVFSINELRNPEGKCLAIYHLQARRVQ
jgi:hypothetical protein